jgi:3-oxoacyl-[acyl-carrier-protein] synthase-3
MDDILYGVKVIGTGKADIDPRAFMDNMQLARDLRERKKKARELLGVKRLPSDLARLHETSDEWIRARMGIRQRPIVGDDIATSDLAISAGKNALRDAGVNPDQVNLLRVATVSPDYPQSPPTASIVALGIGIPLWDVENIQLHQYIATDQSYACSSFPIALMDAVVHIMAGFCEYALVIGADKMSSTADWHNREFCPILSDHAGAIVLKRVPFEESDFRREWFYAGGDGSKADRIITPVGGSRCPLTPDLVKRDPLLSSTKLAMEGNTVFRELVSKMKRYVIPEALKKAGLTPSCVDIVFCHQANIRMIKAGVEDYLRGVGFRDSAIVFNTIHKYGNSTNASTPVGIHDARTEGVLKPGQTVMLVYMGGGYTWAIIFLRWSLK